MRNESRASDRLSGVLLVDKPAGLTSHAVVGRVRRTFGQREVGHTGTLDPAATGLMILTLGRATRIARFIEATEKRYTGTVRLGRATTTFDVEGSTTREVSAEALAAIDRDAVERALASLVGHIAQAVPQFSAVKVDGTRLYSRARRGEDFETPVREVDIHALELVAFDPPDVVIDTRVSKGTYIRSLAVQIGEALGVPAHLAALRRTAVGAHRVEAARSLEALEGTEEELIPAAEALGHLPAVRLDGLRAADVAHGRGLRPAAVRAAGPDPFAAGDAVRLLAPDGTLAAVGIAEVGSSDLAPGGEDRRVFKYACVLSGDSRPSA